MKSKRVNLCATLSLLVLCISASAAAQIPKGSSARALPTDIDMSDSRVSQIIARAEDHFRKGKQLLQINQREKAREEFNRAIDSIIESGFDVRANLRLQTFYLELVERIYREEVPLLIPTPTNRSKSVVGFRDQKFVASRADDLSKPLLTPEIKSAPPISDPGTLAGLRLEYQSATKEYKASLEKLLALYESNLRQAEERFATAKQFYANGLISLSQLDDAARAVSDQREKVVSTRKLISNADSQVAMALLESKRATKDLSLAGNMPSQLANGQVPAVIRYLNDHLNDPYSMKLLNWSKLRIVYKNDQPFWYVTLRMRAKNGFGAYILTEAGFYLKNNKVIFTDNL